MTCDSCGKLCYPTAAAANRAVGRYKARRGHHLRNRNHAYWCMAAGAWHLGHDHNGRLDRKRKG